ncbi:hypothetical protein GGR51DRAFT_207893 [Nemania sp. FL0031]|nr:hypothetical protein GGR51DRAFT_207893 [Nemania sp. FL0031]
MVFPGRFSTGCDLCRKRKIKPRQERPQAPHQAPPLTQNVNSSQTLVQAPRRAAPPAIIPQPEVSYDEVSICYFIRRFVTPDDNDNLPGHLTFLPSLYKRESHGLLELATLSVAQMAAYNHFGGDKFRLQSYQNYGRALGALRKTIQSEDEVTDDRVLAAVLLLTMFKDIGEEGWGDPSEHAPGLYYLLQKRGVEQFCTSRGFELFLLALLKLQVHSFLHQDNRYTDPGGLVHMLSVVDPMMRAMSLMTKTMSLRQDLLKCTSIPSENHNENREPNENQARPENGGRSSGSDQYVLQACFEALEDFDRWDTDAEPYWRNTFHGRSIAALGELATGSTYYDPKTACIIILIRSARLILLLSILEYYDAMQSSCSDTEAWRVGDRAAWENCIPVLEHTIRLAIDDMLYCVPFALGDLGPDGSPVSIHPDGAASLVVFQPLRLVTYCAYATPEQRTCSQNILNRMKTGVGVRSAIPWSEQVGGIALEA